MRPFSSYVAVVWSEPLSVVSQPRSFAASVSGVSRPCEASWPAVALPLLYSMTSGTSSPVSTILAFFWICSNVCFSTTTSTSGFSSSKISIALAQACPMADSSDS